MSCMRRAYTAFLGPRLAHVAVGWVHIPEGTTPEEKADVVLHVKVNATAQMQLCGRTWLGAGFGGLWWLLPLPTNC